MIKDKKGRQLLGLSFFIYFVLTFILDSIYFDLTFYLVFLFLVVNFFTLKNQYSKKINNEKVLYRITGYERVSTKYTVGFIILSIALLALLLFLSFKYELDFELKHNIVLIIFNSWMLYMLFSDMAGKFKVCEGFLIKPGEEMNKIFWTDIERFELKGQNKSKLLLFIKENKPLILILKKLSDENKDSFVKLIEDRCEKAVQHGLNPSREKN